MMLRPYVAFIAWTDGTRWYGPKRRSWGRASDDLDEREFAQPHGIAAACVWDRRWWHGRRR